MGDSSNVAQPVPRFLMAHSCLASNRNNTSLLLFGSSNGPQDDQAWAVWANAFFEYSNETPVSAYLAADADARLGRLQEAEGKLSAALKQNRDFALAYNARGVLRTLNEQWDEALLDLEAACCIAPTLADAFASLGTYWVLRETPTGAMDAAEKALAINPEFALAYNVRGCAYFGRGEYLRASEDFSKAAALCRALCISELNCATSLCFGSSR